jgi:hypothetical protein
MRSLDQLVVGLYGERRALELGAYLWFCFASALSFSTCSVNEISLRVYLFHKNDFNKIRRRARLFFTSTSKCNVVGLGCS